MQFRKPLLPSRNLVSWRPLRNALHHLREGCSIEAANISHRGGDALWQNSRTLRELPPPKTTHLIISVATTLTICCRNLIRSVKYIVPAKTRSQDHPNQYGVGDLVGRSHIDHQSGTDSVISPWHRYILLAPYRDEHLLEMPGRLRRRAHRPQCLAITSPNTPTHRRIVSFTAPGVPQQMA
jgi:hypothetical protein